MTVGAPRTWVLNDLVTATRWDQESRDQSNALLGKPRAKLVKTVKTMYDNSDAASVGSGPRSLVNVIFDIPAYDLSYDGSTMAYGSTLMANIPGWYRFTAAHYWDVSAAFGTATPLIGTRHIGIGVNTGGQWLNDRYIATAGFGGAPILESKQLSWTIEPALTTSGTALIQGVRAAPAMFPMNQGDYVEMFVGQDSGNPLNDYVVNLKSTAASGGAAGFSTFLAAEWVGNL